MAYTERKIIIEKIEKLRGSKVITLITSDRLSTLPIQGIVGQISPDQVPQIVKHLKSLEDKFKEIETIDLFIHSSGGDTNTAWPLVNVIRNYSKKFNVLIAVKAHSAATLISLGANDIIMSRTASISSVDPTVTNAFNPKENNQPKGISVEDVTSFLALAKENEFNIESEGYIMEVFKLLAQEIHPLALGNVKRTHTQIRELATKLLSLNNDAKEPSIELIVNGLTEKLHSHYHSIFIDEAKNMGMKNVNKANAEEEKLFWDLYKDYEDEMLLSKVFDANMFLGDETQKELETITTLIESSEISSKYIIRQNLIKTPAMDPGVRLQILGLQSQLGNSNKQAKASVAQIQSNVQALSAQLAPFLLHSHS